jgi:hypothetical protein
MYLTIAGTLALLVGIGFGGLQTWRLIIWPRVDATVVSSRIIEDVSENSRQGTRKPIFRPEIAFRFTWQGAPHDGRGAASFWSTDRTDAQALADSFPRGSVHAIHVNPDAPGEVRFDLVSIEGFKVPLYAGVSGGFALLIGTWLRRRIAAVTRS